MSRFEHFKGKGICTHGSKNIKSEDAGKSVGLENGQHGSWSACEPAKL